MTIANEKTISNGILIVDDEAIVRDSLKDWLNNSGYDVITAENGEEALIVVRKQEVGINLIDIRLPEHTGISVLKEKKTKNPPIKAIVITAYPALVVTKETHKLGAIDCVVKPIDHEDLEKLIRGAVRDKTREAKE